MMTFVSSLHMPFTGLLNGVNGTGRALGKEVPLFVSRELIKKIDAMSQLDLRGGFRVAFLSPFFAAQLMENS